MRVPATSSQRHSSYCFPDPLASEDGFKRCHNLDLAEMAPWERWAENWAAREALAAIALGASDPLMNDGFFPVYASDWLVERIRRSAAR
jgi:hypothetical protein